MKDVKKDLIEMAVSKMRDTDDPIDGSVFEKTVSVDFPSFCAFILTQYDNVTMEMAKENDGSICYLFYNGNKGTDHVATYVTKASYGCETIGHGFFGGSRVGSKNTAWNQTGAAIVNNAFSVRF